MTRFKLMLALLTALFGAGCGDDVTTEEMGLYGPPGPTEPEPTPPLEEPEPTTPEEEPLPEPSTPALETDCTNGVDDNMDGFADCADANCRNQVACQADETPGLCDLNTQVAVKISANVSWEGTLGLQPGSGPLNIWYMADLEQDSAGVRASGRVCGAEIPDFHTTEIAGGDTHGTVIPESVWTAQGLPSVDLQVQLSASEPGGSLVANPVALLLGAEMGDPLNEPWPSSYTQLTSVDHDGDGYPGITANVAQGAGYAMPRVAVLNPNLRARNIFLGLRTIVGLDGMLETCDTASGSATLHLDQRSLGCILENGDECRPRNTDILDSNTPAFDVSGATFTLVRLPAGSNCGAVRSALP